jgi:HemY protein
MAPLVAPGERPTSRMCLLMAEIEEAQNGDMGAVREWLARGSRAPSDAAWIADGIISSQWAPISPVTGKLDAFEWRQPDERLDYIEAMPQIPEEIETKEAPPALSAPEPISEGEGHENVAEEKEDGSGGDAVPVVAETSAETETAQPRRARRAAAARPVMFPQPVPPDDPGTEPEKVRRVV